MGIAAPKGCLMYGPPGTGKTLLARACAAQTKARSYCHFINVEIGTSNWYKGFV